MSNKVITMQQTANAATTTISTKSQPADIISIASGQLNEAQLAAATSLEGKHVIIAGPGCGKSKTLCEKAKLIKSKFPNDSVLLLSFSRRAVTELKTRLGDLYRVECKTFHSLAYFIIRASGLNFKLDTSDDQEAVIQNLLIKGSKTTVNDVLLSLRSIDGAGANKDTLIVRSRYLSWLHEHKLLTFNTMQLIALFILKKHQLLRRAFQNRWQWIICDEYNDVDTLQVELLELLSSVSGNLTVAGDSRQQIYQWRGAVPNSLEAFAKTATRHELTENYRSNTSVVELCNSLTPNDTPLKAASNAVPIPVQFNSYKDAETEARAIVDEIVALHSKGLAYKDIAILYRNSSSTPAITSELLRRKIPFFAKSRLFSKYEGNKIWRDLINLFYLSLHQNSQEALKPVLPLLYLKQDSIKEIKTIAKKENISLLDATRHLNDRPVFQKDHIDELATAIKNTAYMQNNPALAARSLSRHGYERHLKNGTLLSIERIIDELSEFPSIEVFLGHVEETKKNILAMRELATKNKDTVSLLSVFVAKGLEYNTVFLPSVHTIGTDRADVNIQEERNVLFVGVSRAISRLYISYTKFSDTSIELNQPCPFLKDFFKG